jgi:hypothetical protein
MKWNVLKAGQIFIKNEVNFGNECFDRSTEKEKNELPFG